MQHLQGDCTVLSKELLAVKKECSQMELEFEQKKKADQHDARNYKDIEFYIKLAKSESQRRGEEQARMKKLLNSIKHDLAKVRSNLLLANC